MQFDIQGDIAFLQRAGVLKLLLKDRTTDRHILWGTDAYGVRGPEYARDQEMEIGQIVGENLGLLKTRAQKAAEQQTERTRQHAEVFTSAWICRRMNDQADAEWFGRENVFFQPDGTPTERVDFKRKSWKRYVDSKRLEITCGEAPYLVSRYDVSSGDPIPLPQRVGMLDRKLRVVHENTDTEADWLKWAFRAYEATYGYEFQGDNLLIARVNLMMTFAEALDARWRREPTGKEWQRLSRIVTWNIWQMDGLTYTLPYAKGHELLEQTDFLSQIGFSPAEEESTQPYCKIFLWRYLKGSSEFRRIKEGADGMKFDFIIGNPPYQDETLGDNGTFAPPIYHRFIEESYQLGNVVELIHPARFLFNAGSTPKAWNKMMLNDPHFKILLYRAEVNQVFPNTNINGGIAISYHDETKLFGPIEVFAQFEEMNTIRQKTSDYYSFSSISKIVYSAYSYHLTDNLYKDHSDLKGRLSKGHEYDLKSNILELMQDIFSDKRTEDYQLQILGRKENSRAIMWTNRKYVIGPENLDKYKVFLAGADGAAGTVGKPIPARVIGVPSIGMPGMGSTESFISIGAFETEQEANNVIKYLKTKFLRTLLSIMKVTQAITPEKFKFIPLQDFTPSSDIDWSVSIPEIDRQLYAKYGLDENEIAFIESHVKEMV